MFPVGAFPTMFKGAFGWGISLWGGSVLGSVATTLDGAITGTTGGNIFLCLLIKSMNKIIIILSLLMGNWCEGFIEHSESAKISFRGLPGNVWQLPANNKDANIA